MQTEEVEEHRSPHVAKHRETLEGELRRMVLSGDVAMAKNKQQIPIKAGNYVVLAEILLKKDYQDFGCEGTEKPYWRNRWRTDQ